MGPTTPDEPPGTPPDRAPAGRAQAAPGPGLVIARPFGIPVYVSPYWFLLAGVFIFVYAGDLADTLHGTTRYTVAAAFVVLLYACVLAHELGHSLLAKANKLQVRRILLFPLGGYSEIAERPSPGQEFWVSAAGPGTSLALAGAWYGLEHLTVPGSVPWVLMRLLTWGNGLIGVFNLLPGLPLDGGQMLRAVIWKFTGKPASATIAAAWTGRVLAVCLLIVPLVTGWANRAKGDMVSALWLAMIAIFMWIGAGQAIRATRFRERLPSLQARRLARKAVSVTASTPLAEAIRRAEESQARAVIVVDHEDKPIAIVNESAVMATPPQRRPWIEAGTLARSLEPRLVLSADLSGKALLDALQRNPATEYLLVEPSGQVYGVLAARDVQLAFTGV